MKARYGKVNAQPFKGFRVCLVDCAGHVYDYINNYLLFEECQEITNSWTQLSAFVGSNMFKSYRNKNKNVKIHDRNAWIQRVYCKNHRKLRIPSAFISLA